MNKFIYFFLRVFVNLFYVIIVEGDANYLKTYCIGSNCFLLGSIYKNLKYYEVIKVEDLAHKIVKRGVEISTHPYNHIKEVSFKTHGRDFRLILSPKLDILHSNFKAYSVDGDGKESSVHIGKFML